MSVNTKVNGQLVKSAGLYKASVPIQSGDIYSFEERQVGVWADGKPLYQKTIDCGALPNNTTKTIAHGVSDIDYISSIKGTAYSSTNGYTLTLEDIDVQAGINYAIRLYADTTDIYLFTKSNQSIYDTCYVTIQYTKTTDVAGSGIWTPSGDYAEHYTTDEQVIGTYLGETLYQKTFRILKSDFTNTGTNTYSYSWSLPFDSIVSIDAIMKANNAFVQIPNGTINQNYSNYISSVTTSALSMYMNATSVYANLQYVDITLKYTKAS